jgi:hypothetical protein
MIPGYGSSRLKEDVVASAATILLKADLIRLTGTTQVDNMFSPVNMGRDGVLVFIYTPDAGVTISAAGNVAVSQALITNRLYAYVFSNTAAKWIPHGVV